MRKVGLLLVIAGLWLNGGGVSAQLGGDIVGVADLGPEGTLSTATFYDLGAAGTRINAVIQGLPPGSRHAMHLHLDQCGEKNVEYPLVMAVADSQGTANAETLVPGKVDFARWYVDLHADTTDASTALACGQVHPALAGAPPPGAGVPEMPRTGQDPTIGWPLVLGVSGGLAVLLAGLYLVARRRRRA